MQYNERVKNTFPKYECSECGWIGPEMEMDSDGLYNDIDCYSYHICPQCNYWHNSLEDYRKIEDEKTLQIL